MLTSRRALQRFDIIIALEFKRLHDPSEYFYGITRNYSYDGFCIETQCPAFEPGEYLEIKLKHPQRDLVVTAPGEVSWKKKSDKFACVMGIKLSETDVENKLKILGIMSTTGDIPVDSFLMGENTESETENKEWDDWNNQLNISQDEILTPEALSEINEHINYEDQENNDLFNMVDTDLKNQEPEDLANDVGNSSEQTIINESEHVIHDETTESGINKQSDNFEDHESNDLFNIEDINLKAQEPEDLANDVGSSSEKTKINGLKHVVHDEITESISNESSGNTLQGDMGHIHYNSKPPEKDNRKNKNWLYIVIATASIAVLSYTLPSLFNKSDKGVKSPIPVVEKSIPRQEKSNDVIIPPAIDERSTTVTVPEIPKSDDVKLSKTTGSKKTEQDRMANARESLVSKNTEDNRGYYIQVGAWKNPKYAQEMLSKLKKYYPDARIIKQDNFNKVRIPGIMSKEKGNSIVKDIEDKFRLKALLVSIK
jgi:hypothetical protein